MFRTARIKMTAGYVLIVMVLSLAFSWGMYAILQREVERFSEGQRLRIERTLQDQFILSNPDQPTRLPLPPLANPDLEQETLYRIQMILIGVNVGIFVLATGLCYLLAGRTLDPIQAMVDEQRRFVSDASHEFKTPLTSIRTTFEVALRNDKLSLPEAKQLIKENLTEVEDLQALNEALLKLDAYQKYHDGQNFETVQLDEAVRAAVKKITPLAHRQKITLEEQLEPVSVWGSLAQLTELSVILLDNAVKYSPKGTIITVVTSAHRHTVQLQVIDRGIGISETLLPHIFDRFYRADASRTKNQVPGYGLGLAIAQRITELHQGKLAVKSEVGRGSTFTLSLPRKNV